MLDTVRSDIIEAIISLKEFKNGSGFKKNGLVAISILDPNNNEDMSEFYKEFDDFLQIKFWDAEENDPNEEPLTLKDGEIIAKFIESNKDKKFVVHCSAGISRSAGVGLAIEAIVRHHGDKYTAAMFHSDVKNNRRYSPNRTVYDKILIGYKSEEVLKECIKCKSKFKEFVSGQKNGKECKFCPICYKNQ